MFAVPTAPRVFFSFPGPTFSMLGSVNSVRGRTPIISSEIELVMKKLASRSPEWAASQSYKTYKS